MRQNRKTLRTEYPGNVGRSNCCGGTYSYYNLDGSPVHNCGQWYTNIPCSAVTSEFACNLNEMYQTYWTYCSYNAPVVMDFTDCHGCGAPGTGGPVQTLRIEQAPLKIIAVDPGKKDEKPYTL